MTRDNAIAIYLRSPYQKGCTEWRVAGEFIDKFVALGMLKLDEPKSIVDRIQKAICELPIENRGLMPILNALAAQGLKIVEK